MPINNMEDIHDIKLPIESDVSWWPIYLIAGIIVLGVFFILVYILYKKLQKTVAAELPKEPEPETDYRGQALKKLEKLYPYIEAQRFEDFFVELSFIVKEYLGGTHKRNAIEMTSFELMRSFKIQELKDLFSICYRHEFAGISAQTRDAEKAFEIANEIITKN